jgi:hypothetical protein
MPVGMSLTHLFYRHSRHSNARRNVTDIYFITPPVTPTPVDVSRHRLAVALGFINSGSRISDKFRLTVFVNISGVPAAS